MQSTTTGGNRTGAAISPKGTEAMLEAAAAESPHVDIDTSASEAERINYINEADGVGSIPPPASLKGVVKSGLTMLKGADPALLMDKIGERLAFERAGVRLYDALLLKYEALTAVSGDVLPAAAGVISDMDALDTGVHATEIPAETMARIRSEELQHFRMLGDAMRQLGGDPTAQTPCADVQATASMGLMQVVTDPRTTLAQTLNAMLTVELADNAGWELLIQLADDAGQTELSGKFLGAMAQEEEHLAVIKGWLSALVLDAAGTEAV